MNCYHIDLKINPLITDELLIKKRHTKVDVNYINPLLIDFLAKLNLRIHLAEIFYSHPFYISPIHIDTLPGDFTKLNWQFKGLNSKMCWYKEIIRKEQKNSLTSIGTSFVSYNESEVELIESNDVRFPSLVQAGVPHNIKNNKEDRWVLSIVFKNIHNNKRPTMFESLEIFEDFLIDQDQKKTA